MQLEVESRGSNAVNTWDWMCGTLWVRLTAGHGGFAECASHRSTQPTYRAGTRSKKPQKVMMGLITPRDFPSNSTTVQIIKKFLAHLI